MRSKIYCLNPEHSKHAFYLRVDDRDYYLFTQTFRKSVEEYFASGVSVDEAIDASRARRNMALLHTMDKLPSYIRYIESEYGVQVLEQTKKSKRKGQGD